MSIEIVERWIRPEIRALNAYHVPPSGKMIKLDAMENPYSWPEQMKQQWLSHLYGAAVNRYPDPSPTGLKQRLAEVMQVPEGMEILLGNGSDELIQIICMALSNEDKSTPVVMAPEPSFVMYQMISLFTKIRYKPIALDEHFNLDMPAILAAIEREQPAVIFLAYPNNPTGNLFAEADIRKIIEMSSGLVVVDEAYHAFADKSFMPMLNEYNNLLVMRTVSKMGLAGLRLGLLAGHPDWINELDKLRLPYNINVLTQLSAEFALQHHAVLEQQTRQICADRELLARSLEKINGVKAYPSAANFILFKLSDISSEVVFNRLKQAGILIKRFADASGPLANCLRVTVGKKTENAAFLQALKHSLDIN